MVVLCKQITWNLQSFVEEEITCGILHDTLSREVLSTFYLLGPDSIWGGGTFSYFLLLYWTICFTADLRELAELKAKVCCRILFLIATRDEKISKETLPSVCHLIKLFIFKLPPRRDRFLNIISSQEATNPEILEVLAKLIYFFGLLLKNVLNHVPDVMMGTGGEESIEVNRAWCVCSPISVNQSVQNN